MERLTGEKRSCIGISRRLQKTMVICNEKNGKEQSAICTYNWAAFTGWKWIFYFTIGEFIIVTIGYVIFKVSSFINERKRK